MNNTSHMAIVQIKYLQFTVGINKHKTLRDLACNKLEWQEPWIPSLSLKLILSVLALESFSYTLWLTLIKALTGQLSVSGQADSCKVPFTTQGKAHGGAVSPQLRTVLQCGLCNKIHSSSLIYRTMTPGCFLSLKISNKIHTVQWEQREKKTSGFL